MDINDYTVEYTEKDNDYEIDLVESDLFSVKKFFTDALEEKKSRFGRVVAHIMGAENPHLKEDLEEISENLGLDDDPEELQSLVDSQKEKNMFVLQEKGNEGMRMMYLTNLMAYKYIFDLDDINPSFEVEDIDKYNTDVSLTGDELRKATHENIVKLEKELDNLNMTVGVNKEEIEEK